MSTSQHPTSNGHVQAIIRTFPGRVLQVTVLSSHCKRSASFDSCVPEQCAKKARTSACSMIDLYDEVSLPLLLVLSLLLPRMLTCPLQTSVADGMGREKLIAALNHDKEASKTIASLLARRLEGSRKRMREGKVEGGTKGGVSCFEMEGGQENSS
eukprot:765148-Hanusia_phi.AAC.3